MDMDLSPSAECADCVAMGGRKNLTDSGRIDGYGDDIEIDVAKSVFQLHGVNAYGCESL